MKDITQILLKKGIMGLVYEDQEHFKTNVVNSIAYKLNESLKQIKKEVQTKLLYSESLTENEDNIKNFIKFINNFQEGKYTFKNGMNINITESEVKNLISLFESLNSKNRKLMAKEIFETPEKFKEHIKFSQEAKGII
jgi:hypothetical protein